MRGAVATDRRAVPQTRTIPGYRESRRATSGPIVATRGEDGVQSWRRGGAGEGQRAAGARVRLEGTVGAGCVTLGVKERLDRAKVVDNNRQLVVVSIGTRKTRWREQQHRRERNERKTTRVQVAVVDARDERLAISVRFMGAAADWRPTRGPCLSLFGPDFTTPDAVCH